MIKSLIVDFTKISEEGIKELKTGRWQMLPGFKTSFVKPFQFCL